MPSVISALAQHYPAVINRMPSPFTAHEFIQSLTQEHQALYIDALHHYRNSPEPFTTVHQQLGAQLLEHPHLIRKIGNKDSKTLFDTDSIVSEWEKI